MSSPIARAYVQIVPDFATFNTRLKEGVGGAVASSTRDLEGLNNGVQNSTEHIAEHTGGLFTKVKDQIKDLAAFAIPALGLVEGVKFFKESVAAAEAERKALLQTAAVLKSTGGAAHVTANNVKELADSQSVLTGITATQIMSNENLLLTFTNVRNGVGKGNDIFNQTTKAVLDMSVAMKEDGKSATIQLGKAIQDPIKGVTALARVGVLFTVQQKAQIKTMVDSGNTLGAQKIILREVTKEFGGSAAAQASAGDKMKAAFEKVRVELGDKLLPIIDRVSNWITTKVLPAFMGMFEELGHGEGPLETVKRAFEGVWAIISPLISSLISLAKDAWPKVVSIMKVASGVFADVGKWMQSHATLVRALLVGLLVFWAAWKGYKIIMAVREAMMALNLVMIANPIGIVIAAIAGLIAAFVYAYKNSETFRNGVNKVWTDIKVVAVAVWDFLKGYLKAVFAYFMAIFTFFKDLFTGKWSKLWKDFIAIFARLWGVLRAYINVVLKVLEKAFSLVWTGIQNAWSAMLRWFTAVFKNLWGVLSRAVSTALRALTALFNMIWNQIKSAWSSLWHSVMSIFNSLWSALRRTVSSALHTLASIFSSTWNTIKNAWSGMLHWFGSAFSSIWSGLMGVARNALNGFKSLFTGLVNGLKAIWHGIETIFMTPVKWVVSYVINPLISAIDILPGINIKPVHLAEGGVVPGGHDRDDVPIYATPGEVVVPKNVVKKHGGPKEFMASLGFGQGPMTAGSHHSGWNWNPIHDIEKVGATVGHAVAGAAGAVAKYIRKGAAAAVSLALKPLRGLSHQLDHFGEFGVDIDHSINHVMDTVVNWIKGKEKKDPASAGAGIIGTGGANMAGIWADLIQNNWSPAQAAGIMGNMEAESGFNPFIVQGGGTSMNPADAGGGGYGLVQWTPGSKLIPLLHGKAPSVGTEVAALTEQLNGSESSAGGSLRRTTDPGTAAAVFGLEYERYAGGQQYGRSASAEAIYNLFTTAKAYVNHAAGSGHVGYEKGAWDVPKTQLAMLHKKEMVIPADRAEQFRKESRTGGGSIDPNVLAKAVAGAIAGMTIQFDGDGLARLVTRKQNAINSKGPRR